MFARPLTAVVAAGARTSNVNLGSENQSAAIGVAAAIMSDVRRARTADTEIHSGD
jgi:hypothetical protein